MKYIPSNPPLAAPERALYRDPAAIFHPALQTIQVKKCSEWQILQSRGPLGRGN